MTVSAKTLIENKFWILEEDGYKIGTLQKNDTKGWIFLGKKDDRVYFDDEDSLLKKFGCDIFTEHTTRVVEEDRSDYDVHGYPVNQKPYNAMFNVQKQLPIYTKTPKSKSLFCAGYFIIKFEKGWRKAYCPKLITLQRYPFEGPMKTRIEMLQVLNNAIKKEDTNTTN